jgi:hypothetical protein
MVVFYRTEEVSMKLVTLTTALSLIAVSTAAFSQGVSNEAPGQRMQSQTKQHAGYPGASYYAPGQEMKRGVKKSSANSKRPGASGYAPGHSTTGSGTYR